MPAMVEIHRAVIRIYKTKIRNMLKLYIIIIIILPTAFLCGIVIRIVCIHNTKISKMLI